MTRTLTVNQRRCTLANEYQPKFAFDNVDDLFKAVVEIDDTGIAGGSGNGPRSGNPAFTHGTIEVYGEAGAAKYAWVKCTVTGQSMYFRNAHHVKGVKKMLEVHASNDARVAVGMEAQV